MPFIHKVLRPPLKVGAQDSAHAAMGPVRKLGSSGGGTAYIIEAPRTRNLRCMSLCNTTLASGRWHAMILELMLHGLRDSACDVSQA